MPKKPHLDTITDNEIKKLVKELNKKSEFYGHDCYKIAEYFVECGNADEACEWYNEGAGEGNYSCQYRLGKAYEDGFFTKKDKSAVLFQKNVKEAIKLYEKAEIFYSISSIYYNGEGVKQDYKLAFKYAKMDAEKIKGQFHPSSILARLYFYGQGCERSYKDAFICYRYNVKSLEEEDYLNLITCCEKLYKNYKELGVYKVAMAHLENSEYYDAAADIYLEGKYVIKNLYMAERFYELAASVGYDNAESKLENVRQLLCNGIVNLLEKNHKSEALRKKLIKELGFHKREEYSFSYGVDVDNGCYRIDGDMDIDEHYNKNISEDYKAWKGKKKHLPRTDMGNMLIYAEARLKSNPDLYKRAYYLLAKYYYERSHMVVRSEINMEIHKKYKNKLYELGAVDYLEKLDFIDKSYKELMEYNGEDRLASFIRLSIKESAKSIKLLIDNAKYDYDHKYDYLDYQSSYSIGTPVSFSSSPSSLSSPSSSSEASWNETTEFYGKQGSGYHTIDDDYFDYRGKSIVDSYTGARTGLRLRGNTIVDDNNVERATLRADGKVSVIKK